ncbi:hypothetical protein Btru_042969 [Bulinus truncatus]|nr:hypothetical protein Btru_042969 [Bulinus truncatus]
MLQKRLSNLFLLASEKDLTDNLNAEAFLDPPLGHEVRDWESIVCTAIYDLKDRFTSIACTTSNIGVRETDSSIAVVSKETVNFIHLLMQRYCYPVKSESNRRLACTSVYDLSGKAASIACSDLESTASNVYSIDCKCLNQVDEYKCPVQCTSHHRGNDHHDTVPCYALFNKVSLEGSMSCQPPVKNPEVKTRSQLGKTAWSRLSWWNLAEFVVGKIIRYGFKLGAGYLNIAPIIVNGALNQLRNSYLGPYDGLNWGSAIGLIRLCFRYHPGNLNTGQSNLSTGQGNLNTGKGKLNTGQGNLNTGQGYLITGQGNLNTGQGPLLLQPQSNSQRLLQNVQEVSCHPLILAVMLTLSLTLTLGAFSVIFVIWSGDKELYQEMVFQGKNVTVFNRVKKICEENEQLQQVCTTFKEENKTDVLKCTDVDEPIDRATGFVCSETYDSNIFVICIGLHDTTTGTLVCSSIYRGLHLDPAVSCTKLSEHVEQVESVSCDVNGLICTTKHSSSITCHLLFDENFHFQSKACYQMKDLSSKEFDTFEIQLKSIFFITATFDERVTSMQMTRFKLYANMRFVGNAYSVRMATSKFQCAFQCASNFSCSGFHYGFSEISGTSGSSCLHEDRINVNSLIFNKSEKVLIKKKIYVQDLPFDPANLSVTYRVMFSSTLSFGDMAYLRAVYIKHNHITVQFMEELEPTNITYQFKAGCHDYPCFSQYITINNKLNSMWNSSQYVNFSEYNNIVVDKTFELHVLLTKAGIVTYLNGRYLHTLENGLLSISSVDYLLINGTMKVEELSITWSLTPHTLTCTLYTVELKSKLSIGDMVFLRAVLLQQSNVTLQIYEQNASVNVTYEFKARWDNYAPCKVKCVTVANRFNGAWNQTTYFNNTLAVNETFDINILVTTVGIKTYIKGSYMHTLSTPMSINEANYVRVYGGMLVKELSL